MTRSDNLVFFTDREAWTLFRVGAFAEAIGWTLLISGITYKHFGLPNNHDVLKILGQTHGTLFFSYFAALLAVARSLRLTRIQFGLALLASLPPYGTLVYEKYLAYLRRREATRAFRRVIVRAIVRSDDALLLVQPVRGTQWCFPGGEVSSTETNAAALERLMQSYFNVQIADSKLVTAYELNGGTQPILELYYEVIAPKNAVWNLTNEGRREYDECRITAAADTIEISPRGIIEQL